MRCESCGCQDGGVYKYNVKCIREFPDVGGFEVDLCDHCEYDGDTDQVIRNVNSFRRYLKRAMKRAEDKERTK